MLQAWSPQGQPARGLLSVGSITKKMGSLVWEKAVVRGAATVSLQRCWVLLTGKKWGLSVVCWGDSRGEAPPQAALCSPLPRPTCPAVCQRDTIRVSLEMPAKPTLTWPQGADGSQLCFRGGEGVSGFKVYLLQSYRSHPQPAASSGVTCALDVKKVTVLHLCE